MGIDRPSTLGSCSWAPGGTALVCDMHQKLYEQQSVKLDKTIEGQKEKTEYGAKRDCMEGAYCDYQTHLS